MAGDIGYTLYVIDIGVKSVVLNILKHDGMGNGMTGLKAVYFPFLSIPI